MGPAGTAAKVSPTGESEMELRQLRAFLQVARAGHFGKAAAALRITQPALTQRIQALERELGVQLLTRSAREVRLTPAGEILLPYATNLIQVEDRAIRDLADSASGRTGKLRVAYLLHGDIATQGRSVAEFRRRYSDVAVDTSMTYSSSNVQHGRRLPYHVPAVSTRAPDRLCTRAPCADVAAAIARHRRDHRCEPRDPSGRRIALASTLRAHESARARCRGPARLRTRDGAS